MCCASSYSSGARLAGGTQVKYIQTPGPCSAAPGYALHGAIKEAFEGAYRGRDGGNRAVDR